MSSKGDKPVHGAVTILAWTLSALLVLFIVLGSWGVFDSGNVDNKECFDYKMDNGEWANSCDQ